jgi:menaquinone-dependent protoporphyrinogen oxidase
MRAAVFYATREGHTRKVAARIADDLRRHGIETDVMNVRDVEEVNWGLYAAACVAASVHIGRHEPEMVAFVKRHRAELARLGAALVSVTLSEAGAQDRSRPEAERRRCADDVDRMIDLFIRNTGWQPSRTLPVAGALAYTKYNFLVRPLMKRIARREGAPTDTSRDHELTDWPAVDRFVDELVKRR